MDNIDWLNKNFYTDDYGYIVWKVFGMYNAPELSWLDLDGNIHNGIIDCFSFEDDKFQLCAPGIHFGTPGFFTYIEKQESRSPNIYACRLRYEWFEDNTFKLVVPTTKTLSAYIQLDMARVNRLEVLGIIGNIRELSKYDGE